MAEQFVTKDECYKTHDRIKGDMSQIKDALVGSDLRSGLVKDVTEIKMTLKNNPNRNNGNGLGKRERAMVYCAFIASGGVIAVEIIKAVVH